jgi:hypothetical protein
MVQAKGCARFSSVLLGLAFAARFSSSVAAAATEPAQIHATSAFLDEVIRTVLPARLDLPRAVADAAFAGARTASLAELKFCGAGEHGAGRFRAVVLQNDVGEVQSLLAIRGSCQVPLGELANPAASLVGQGQALVIADLEAILQGRDLKLWLLRAVIVQGGSRSGAAATFDKRIEIETLSLSALPFDGVSPAIYFHVAPTFRDHSVSLVVAVSDSASNKVILSERGASAPDTILEGQATLAAEVPLSMINVVLHRLTSSKPISLALEGDWLDLRNIRVRAAGSGAAAKITVIGTATPRSIRETVEWTLHLAGEPLLVSSVQAAAQLEDCAGLGRLAAIACDLRNGARVTAAEAFAAALTNRYGSQALHELISPLHTRVSLAGRPIQLSGDVLRLAAGRAGIVAAGNVSAAPAE